MFNVDETKPVIAGREPPSRAAIVHLMTSDFRDLGDISNVTLEDCRRGSQLSSKSGHCVFSVTKVSSKFPHPVPEDQSWDAFTSRA